MSANPENEPVNREHPYAEQPTPRQLEVLQLIADGLADNAEIGRKLFITSETVKHHLRYSFLTLDAHTRAHAVAIALRKGWIE